MADDIAGDGSPGRVDEAPAGAAAFDGFIGRPTANDNGPQVVLYDHTILDTAGYSAAALEGAATIIIPAGKGGVFRVSCTVVIEKANTGVPGETYSMSVGGNGANSGSNLAETLYTVVKQDRDGGSVALTVDGVLILPDGFELMVQVNVPASSGGDVVVGDTYGFAYGNLSLERIGDLPE